MAGQQCRKYTGMNLQSIRLTVKKDIGSRTTVVWKVIGATIAWALYFYLLKYR